RRPPERRDRARPAREVQDPRGRGGPGGGVAVGIELTPRGARARAPPTRPLPGARLKEPESTCWTLVERAAAGDGAAREEFGRRYLPIVRAYLRWTGRLRPDELGDAAPDVFGALLRRGRAG